MSEQETPEDAYKAWLEADAALTAASHEPPREYNLKAGVEKAAWEKYLALLSAALRKELDDDG
ncbi:hypothetical protein ACFVH6_21675 [Spirillospora sp. NPDC127200]